MYFGEDKSKVSNIVKPNLIEFRDLYSPYLKKLATVENGSIMKKVTSHILIEECVLSWQRLHE